MTVAECQQQLVPREDLTSYAGQWVALRDGYVIASALDAVTLSTQPEIYEADVLIPVRRHGADVNVIQGHAITGGEPGPPASNIRLPAEMWTPHRTNAASRSRSCRSGCSSSSS